MSVMTQGVSEYVVVEQAQSATAEARAMGEGTQLNTTYFEFSVSYAAVEVAVAELSDAELLMAAEKTGTFEFLDAPEEDGYNDLLKTRE